MNPYDRRYVMDLIRRDFDSTEVMPLRGPEMRKIINTCIHIGMPKADVQQMIDDYNSEYGTKNNCEFKNIY